jgi:hypothetical protein
MDDVRPNVREVDDLVRVIDVLPQDLCHRFRDGR